MSHLRSTSWLILIAVVPATVASARALPALRAQGVRMVDPAGNAVVLRGCNLGNWLMIEPWMLGGCIEAKDQRQITNTLISRFGERRGRELMDLYREHYVTARDFDLVKSFGLNLVRVPFDFRLLQDEEPPFAMRPEPFKWLDRALELAEVAGVYVILDMHGVPGGQSNQMHTGREDYNRLWDDAAAQQRTIDLWVKIAARYRNRSVIAAWDIMNEPYGDYRTDVSDPLREIMSRAYRAVRSTGDQHVILFPATLGHGIFFYGDLRARGCEQFAFTDHFYPGLFGSPSTLMSHARVIARDYPRIQSYLDAQQAPFLAGEFNVVLDRCGGARMMRRHFDEFARRGWLATLWSYKLLKRAGGTEPDNWYMVTNAEPLAAIDVHRDDDARIESFMRALSTMPLAVDEPLRTALTDRSASGIELPALPSLPTTAPASQAVDGWTGVAVNHSAAHGVTREDGRIVVTAAGRDIFGTADSFCFLQRPAPPEPWQFEATVNSLLDSAAYAKAGLMVRLGRPDDRSYASAPFVMVNVFPDGTVAMLSRDHAGGAATETKRYPGPLPRRIGLRASGSQVQGLVDDGTGQWVSLGQVVLPPSNRNDVRVGMALSSHSETALTRCEFSGLSLLPTASSDERAGPLLSPPAAAKSGQSLLRNGSFDATGEQQAVVPDWNLWGEMKTGTAEQRRVAGGSLLTSESGTDSGIWQDVTVTKGRTYRFAIFAARDGDAEDVERDRPSVELRLETIANGQPLSMASGTFDVRWIESTGGWSTLHVSGVAESQRMRALVRITRPRDANPRAAPALLFKNASFTPVD